jgi:hypothetical protein
MEIVRWIFGRTNVVRMSGVAVIGVVITLFAWLGRLEARADRGTDDAFETWSNWLEIGVLVTGFALLFVAVGLLMGLPEGPALPDAEQPPTVDHWG